MRRSRLSLLAATAGVALLIGATPGFSQSLSGQISSVEEGTMEGVLVSATKDGSNVTVTVASDDKGHYSFPAGRLTPGHYAIAIRAVGFDLDGPKALDIGPGQPTGADIKLVKTHNLARQLTNSEWLMSVPGPENLKKGLYSCTSCHTLERIVRSVHDSDEFLHQILVRMASYSSQSFPMKPQKRVVTRDPQRYAPQLTSFAQFLSTINLSNGTSWEYPLQTLPRPTGRATHMIVTEYDLPRGSMQPHDVMLDPEGTVWFSNFGENMLGEMDVTTGKVTEHPIPMLREGFATGNLDLEFDQSGNIWLGLMNQTGFAKFDKKTGAFQYYRLPTEMLKDATQQAMVAAQHHEVDGKVWFNDAELTQIGQMDLASGKTGPWIQPYEQQPNEPHSVYGLYTDSQNNLFFLDFSNRNIGRIDAKSGEIKLFQTPTVLSRPRRGEMDSQDRLWFAEWYANNLAMFDTKSGQFKEWKVPTPHAAPYSAQIDDKGQLWSAGMNDDRVTRLDTKTGETIEYLLPRETNVRRVFIDKRTGAFWTGSNHGASIVKLETLD